MQDDAAAEAFMAFVEASQAAGRRTGTAASCTPTAPSAARATGSAAGSAAAEQLPVTDWAVPGVTRPAAGRSALLTRLTELLDGLAGHGPLSGSRADVTALLQQTERLRALGLRELAEMDAVGGHQRPGMPASSTASWLRDSRHLSDTAARATVALAVALRDGLPFLGELLLTGQITVEHAAAVRDGVRGLHDELVRDAADGLSQLACCTDPVQVRRRLRDKAHAINDRLAAQAERRARDRAGLHLSDVGSHTAIDGTLAADDGATVRLAMDLAVEADRHDGDRRSRAARQADVLTSWAADYLHRARGAADSLADDAHTVRSHLHILCRPDQLTNSTGPAGPAGPNDSAGGARTLAELLDQDLNGAPPAAAGIAGELSSLSRNALRRLACDATIDLITLHPASTDPLYVGRASRTVTGRQFRALIARDRHCIVQGCRRRPARCAAHHVRHWADGGPSDLDNLVLLCHQHHHDHHDRQHELPHRDGQRWLTQTGWRHAPP